MRRLILLVLAALALVAAGCGGDDSQDERASGGDTAAEATPAPQPEPEPAQSGGCEQVEAPAPKEDGGEKQPGEELDPAAAHRLEVVTNCGSFTIELDAEQSPNAAASMVALARNGFFDGTTFHRIVPGFVIQGGDPTGTGTGGPGYSTVDTPPAGASYTRGVVAMAKTQAEPPGTAGSQFYVVTGADAGLPPDYAIIGKVVEGDDVVETIGQLGDPATEQPTQPVVIETVRVLED